MATERRTYRGRNYDPIEDQAVCRAWVRITEDSNTSMTSERFWDRAKAVYDEDELLRREQLMEDRTKVSLQNRFSAIMKETRRFMKCLKQAFVNLGPDATEHAAYMAAQNIYRRSHPKQKEFEFSLCHEILSTSSKFRAMIDEDENWMAIHPAPLRSLPPVPPMARPPVFTDSLGPSPNNSPPAKRRRQMMHFTPELEHELLVETHARNPFGEEMGRKNDAWEDVAAALPVDLDGRTCREKCIELLDAFDKNRGTFNGEYSEREYLLVNLLEMRDLEAMQLNERIQGSGEQSRDDENAALIHSLASNGTSTQPRKSSKSTMQQLIQYLERRDTRLQAIEKRMIQSEKKRLELEERRIRLQERRLDIERQERLAIYDIIKAAIVGESTRSPPSEV